MSIKKVFSKTKPVCKVSFALDLNEINKAEKVAVLGDFNNWNLNEALELKKAKDGVFKGSIDLPVGKDYEFRYLLDATNWMNDLEADSFIANAFGVENSVIKA
jgi:1,4-alpha-glucan branching enzyme